MTLVYKSPISTSAHAVLFAKQQRPLLKYQQAFHVRINSLIFQLNAQMQYPQGIELISERNILLEDLAVGHGR